MKKKGVRGDKELFLRRGGNFHRPFKKGKKKRSTGPLKMLYGITGGRKKRGKGSTVPAILAMQTMNFPDSFSCH